MFEPIRNGSSTQLNSMPDTQTEAISCIEKNNSARFTYTICSTVSNSSIRHHRWKKNHSISYLFSFFSDLFFLSKFSIHINSMDINAKLIITKKKLEPQHICRYIRNTTQQKWKSRKIHSAIYYNTRAMKIDWKAQPHTRFDVSEYIGK